MFTEDFKDDASDSENSSFPDSSASDDDGTDSSSSDDSQDDKKQREKQEMSLFEKMFVQWKINSDAIDAMTLKSLMILQNLAKGLDEGTLNQSDVDKWLGGFFKHN